MMSDTHTPHFHNEAGVPIIRIGTRTLQCIGAKPPFDHPHIFLEMGEKMEITCPYCSTVYKYEDSFTPTQSNPHSSYISMTE